MTNKIERIPRVDSGDVEREEYVDPNAPAVGRWYWIRIRRSEQVPTGKRRDYDGRREYKDHDVEVDQLACVTHVGSNYAKLTWPQMQSYRDEYGTVSMRVHLNDFADRCRPESDPKGVIDSHVAKHQFKAAVLMGHVQEITERLALSMGGQQGALPSRNEGAALTVVGPGNKGLKQYESALVKAKDQELPDLFEDIKRENQQSAMWMTASLIPLQAQAQGLQPIVKAIQGRIFNVELYAGLTETVEKIKDGKPANVTEKIHLFQRRHYMDEECLANYETGGMEYHDLRDFDEWLTRKDNLERILPYPRCIVAFQVRRHEKEREFETMFDAIVFALSGMADVDKLTFLYIRNGTQVFRLATKVSFGSQLFPDPERAHLIGKLYADNNDNLITEGDYLDRVERYRRHRREKAEDVRSARRRKIPRNKWNDYEEKPDGSKSRVVRHAGYFSNDGLHDSSQGFTPFTPAHIRYDDIRQKLQDDLDAHNRLVLVLQGLLDRSLVLHPHPRWNLMTPEGFEAALQLIYDDSRAIAPGAKPDFEAYRERLNTKLKVGDVCIGQEVLWEQEEARRFNEDNRRRSDHRDYRDKKRYRPYGNPGPGRLARCVAVTRTGKVTFRWLRERQTAKSRNYWSAPQRDLIPCTFTCNVKDILNVTAYTPGDFKQFYADPRTRADYLKWAPLLLISEEWHAGNLTLDKPIGHDRAETINGLVDREDAGWNDLREARHQKHTRKRKKAEVDIRDIENPPVEPLDDSDDEEIEDEGDPDSDD